MSVHAYTRYARFKDSGVEWLGNIPEPWQTKRLKWVAPRDVRKAGENDSRRRYVGLENVESWTGRYLPTEAAEQANGDSLLFEDDSLLFGKLRPYLAKVLKPDFPGRCTGEFLVLSARAVSRAFLHVFLLSDPFVRTVDSSTFGAKMPRADWRFIGNLPVPLPSGPEQRVIADFLDRETARIDALIAKQERLIELLGEKRKAMISHAVTQGLNPHVKMKESGVEWLGKIPEHWEVKRLTYMFRERDERAQPDLPLLNVSIHDGVTVREFSNTRIEQMADDFNVYKVAAKDDIAFNKMRMWQGAVGVVPVDGLVSPDYTVAHPVVEMDVSYYSALFRTDRFFVEVIGQSHGIVWDRLRLYWEGFKDIYVPVPPFAEQQAIVRHLGTETEYAERTTAKVRQLIERLREKRTALISAAVTGKIDVREVA